MRAVSSCGGIPQISSKRLVGIAIHDPIIGAQDISLSTDNRSVYEIQPFQLSPEHRVYGFQKVRIRLHPMVTIKFGVDNDN